MMKRNLKLFTIAVFTSASLISCKKESNTQQLVVNITGLEDLGANARYEGWIIVNGTPVSTGIFTVNATGQLSKTSFDVDKTQLANTTTFVLTVEPFPDANPAPSDQHLLGGDFSVNNAALTIGHPAALNTTFSAATGKYVLATPTTITTADELSGLWFLSLTGGSPAVGLSLPTLPTGWKYEGWALISGKPVSTGVFISGTGADATAPFSGTSMAPPFPGEDFINNAPSGLTFPTNLSGGLAVISVEPFPDNSAAPFLLKPLVGNIPSPAADHVTYNLALNTVSFPKGTAVRN
ncbi:MAG: anti-sigma factor [Bacteroidota bacterium]|nr:anti-sigma factor [Bacteroidota bacterium]